MDKFKKLFIKPDISINKTMKQMDEAAEKILFVVDDEDKLLGSVTDGDIRRWILKGKSLNAKISQVMNRSPKYLQEGFFPEEAKKIMVDHKLESLPILNKQKCLVAVTQWLDFFESKPIRHQKIDLPVAIMAGGEGSRLVPLTKILPKALLPIGEEPIIALIIDKFVEYGCKNFHLSVNYKANIIKAYFKGFRHNYKIQYLNEKTPLGTAGSLRFLKNRIKGPLFVSNCDMLIDADYADIAKFHKEKGNKITIVTSMKHHIIPYGVCDIKTDGLLKGIKEKPEYNFLVNTGLYILESDVLSKIPKKDVYHLTDLINDCLNDGEKIGVYPISDKSWIDMGQWETFYDMLKHHGI